MANHKVDFIISAASSAQYPIHSQNEYVLSGRSNVGKSTFINTILSRKNIAYTSSQPGKTQTLNFFHIDDAFYFVDVPGYGYARVSQTERKKFGQMIEEYLTNRTQLTRVFLLIDARHLPTEDDCIMYDYLKFYHIPTTIIATKIDKVNKTKQYQHINRIKAQLELDNDDFIIPFSSITKQGITEVWNVIQANEE